MKNAKRFLTVLLCVLMIVPALAACSSTKEPNAAGTEPAGAASSTEPVETAPATTARKDAKDNLPEGLNFNGAEIKIHTRGGQNRQLDIDGGGEETGDLVRDTVYAKARSVEERLKVKLVTSDNTAGYKQIGEEIEKSVLAGDDQWQIIATSSNATIQFSRDYLFQPVQDNKYLDFDQPWWWDEAMYEMTLDMKNVRYLIGDTNLSAYNYSGAVLYNKDLFEDFGGKEDELYKLVFDGKWTMDKLGEYASAMNKDVDGDGKWATTDVLGFYIDTFEYVKFLEYACDVRRYTRDASNFPVPDLDLDRGDVAVNTMLKLIKETKGVLWDPAEKTRRRDVFAQGNTVFYGGILGDAYNADVRAMEAEYGVIPYPKLDENQAEYTTFIHNSTGMFSIPITNKNPDAACATLEAMCSEAYRSVIEVYFEIALKGKYSSDPNSGKCVDLIKAAAKKYFFAEYNSFTGGLGFIFSNQIKDGKNTLASSYASLKDQATEKLKAFLADMTAKEAK